MAGYKVSYKVLREQGDEMKAVAKLIDSYADRVNQISGKLGEGEMLAEVRNNLGKLRAQLGESRAVLNTSGELLIKSVESYGGTEIRQVKKVDGMKAHNRDFYKNPVVVASAGGAVGGAVSAAAPPASTTTVNYTDQSVNITYTAEPVADAQAVPAAQPVQAATPSASGGVAPVNTASVSPAPASVQPEVSGSNSPVSGGAVPNGAKIAAGTMGGVAAGVGAVLGGKELKKKRDAEKAAKAAEPPENHGYDPEAELAKAIQRVRDLENESEEP